MLDDEEGKRLLRIEGNSKKIEKPDAILPTMGGQTALNATLELFHSGILDKYNISSIRLYGIVNNASLLYSARQVFWC